MSFSMTLETRDGVDPAFKIFQFTELVPDRLRASVMVVAQPDSSRMPLLDMLEIGEGRRWRAWGGWWVT